jgi:predicted RNase H-like HicB family nuclease
MRIRNQLVYWAANQLRRTGYSFNEQLDERVQEMKNAILGMENHAIQFKIEQYPDGSWSVESTNIEGIMTGGTDPREIPEMIKDAIFTYFEIPPLWKLRLSI